MDNIKSPLNGDELLKIDNYILENKDELMSLDFEVYSNLKSFQSKVSDFNKYIVDLTVNDKTRAWFYLFSNAKKEREGFKKQKVTPEVNPNYKFTVSDPINSKLSGKKTFGGIVFLTAIMFVFYMFFTKDNEYDKCVASGVQYYKDIGSYPMLSSENILASEKAKNNCKRNSGAFGENH
ncbi:hypothetical protein B9T24_09875 [Acinetobacter sp. ANC 4654]|nr:hypothetical protein B9T24_09875 [Acinetobacter sp. ANC 4654]